MKRRKLTGYVSEIDKFLQEIDKQPAATSANRQAEEAKYKEVFAKRDQVVKLEQAGKRADDAQNS